MALFKPVKLPFNRPRFRMQDEHLKLLGRVYIDGPEEFWTAPRVDPKRPFGNGDRLTDMAEILGLVLFKDADGDSHLSPEQAEYLCDLYAGLGVAMEIVLRTRSFEPGLYERVDWKTWEKIDGA